ncbi:hypothetical protein [Ideonella sp. B508-1]|uniref:hypothetical protein n=1 Tax=Ideonella sp. B508-1 TaxID=137716 RepID=UPI0011D21E57|nr:hypothetical protein [Ideonella sp. B508-1]
MGGACGDNPEPNSGTPDAPLQKWMFMVVALRVFGRLMFWLSMVLMLALALAWAWDRSDTNAAAAATPAVPAQAAHGG